MGTQPPTSPFDVPEHEDPHVAQLIREAKAAIKMGDKASARTKLQEAVGIDQYSEQGWYWLASVVETDEERKVCLGNVVVINPKNARAQEMLDRLNGDLNAGLLRADANESSLLIEEPASATPQRKILMIGGIAAAAVIGLILVLVLVSGASKPAALPTLAPTVGATQAVAVAATNTPVQAAVGVATGAATESTVTPTLPEVAPTLPPTWTPQGAATKAGATTPLPPPPPGLTGRIMAISGSLILAKGNMPVVVVEPQTGKLQQVSAEVGDYAILTPDGQRLIFSRYIASTESKQLRLANANGTQPTELSRLWGNVPPLADVVQPSVAHTGTLIAFSASSLTENDSTPDIFTVPLKGIAALSGAASESTSEGSGGTSLVGTEAATVSPTTAPTAVGTPAVQVKRLTAKDSGVNTWPTFSPNAAQIAYVNDGQPIGVASVDIYVVNVAGGPPKNLTNDNLNAIEAAPEFSPDGSKIAYHAAQQGAKTNNIYIMDADGTNKVQLTEGPGDNIRPHWSPDGKYLAFTSNRSGKWEIYVIALDTKKVYQVTTTQASTIGTSWSGQ